MKKNLLFCLVVFFLLILPGVSYCMNFDNIPNNTWTYDTTQGTAPYDFSGWITLGYDPVHEKALLFGLSCSKNNEPTPDGYANDAWTFDLNTSQWNLIHPSDPYNWGAGPFDPKYPEPRHFFGGVAYDSKRGKILLYGGAHRTRSYNDTWSFDFATNQFGKLIDAQPYWVDATLCGKLTPPYMQGHAIAYDSAADLFILASGSSSGYCGSVAPKTWIYSPTDNLWTQRNSEPQPVGGTPYVYDPVRKRTLLFGGANSGSVPAKNSLQSYDSTNDTWSDLQPVNPPSGRGHASFAYDSKNDIFLLFGGEPIEGKGYLNDTWVYYPNENKFVQISPSVSPLPENLTRGHLMQYDPKRGIFILYTLKGIWYYKYDSTYDVATNVVSLPPNAVHGVKIIQ